MTASELTIPLAAAGATHLAMWTAGSWVRDKLVREAVGDDDPLRHAFQSVLLGFAILSTAALALGALHILYTPLLGAIVALLAAAGLRRLARRKRWTPRAVTLSDVPWIACAAFVVAQLPKALYPVLEHDENVYHLLLPKLYLAAHALSPVPWSMYGNMPHLVDLSFVFPVALGGFTAAKVFVLGFVGWTLVGLAPFGRAMLGPMGPGVLAVLYLSGPVVQLHLGLAYVEPVIAALLLGALQSLWCYGETGEAGSLRVLALLPGAACASKYTVWPFTAALFATAALIRPPGGRRIGLRPIAVMVVCCAALVAPWLVKNAFVTGNPVYPNAYGVFGGTYWSPIQTAQFQHEVGYGRGAEKELGAYLTLPLHVVTTPPDRNLGAAFSAGVMALLIASMAFPWRRGELRTTLRILSIAGFAFWCLGSKQTRFLVAFVPVMAVTASVALAPLRRYRGALASATLAVMLAALAQTRLQPIPVQPVLDVFTVSRDELLSRNSCWDLTALLNRVVPRNGHVLAFWENRLYFLERPFMADSNHGAPAMLGRLRAVGDAHRFAEACAADGVTHVVVNPILWKQYMENDFVFDLVDDPVYPAEKLKADRDLFDRFVGTELTEVPWDGGWAVFRLNAAPMEAGR